ncbi:acetyltransferase (GNAT) family protein [Stella humosa]|uniref:Acetyltransferase (GNAT) family protein n=1 Tax=Stella humosa TaxID=94 RepID=A0A3N1L1V8_9PROT|nr:GNAT family N-acetyltransferase [Stella humosa]ROP84446.1 acetyltransferase (GNAT) family protein [Stella humosa]BBK33964.1 N-acetyltransferase GCN5 [Stella humosa]
MPEDDLRSLPLSHVALTETVRLLETGYAGYVVPVAFDVDGLARRVRAEHVDLAASHLLIDRDGQRIGAMLVARRGRRSRVAALGIAPAARNRGLGRAAIALAIADARRRQDAEIVLEVIAGNAAALRVYTRQGFAAVRVLVGYERPLGGDAGERIGIARCAPDDILHALLAAYPADPSWQASPLCFAGATLPVLAFRSEGGEAAALVQPAGPAMRLLAFAVAADWRGRGLGRRFLNALAAQWPGASWSIPAIVPEAMAAGFFAATGWRRTAISQLEMARVP